MIEHCRRSVLRRVAGWRAEATEGGKLQSVALTSLTAFPRGHFARIRRRGQDGEIAAAANFQRLPTRRRTPARAGCARSGPTRGRRAIGERSADGPSSRRMRAREMAPPPGLSTASQQPALFVVDKPSRIARKWRRKPLKQWNPRAKWRRQSGRAVWERLLARGSRQATRSSFPRGEKTQMAVRLAAAAHSTTPDVACHLNQSISAPVPLCDFSVARRLDARDFCPLGEADLRRYCLPQEWRRREHKPAISTPSTRNRNVGETES